MIYAPDTAIDKELKYSRELVRKATACCARAIISSARNACAMRSGRRGTNRRANGKENSDKTS